MGELWAQTLACMFDGLGEAGKILVFGLLPALLVIGARHVKRPFETTPAATLAAGVLIVLLAVFLYTRAESFWNPPPPEAWTRRRRGLRALHQLAGRGAVATCLTTIGAHLLWVGLRALRRGKQMEPV